MTQLNHASWRCDVNVFKDVMRFPWACDTPGWMPGQPKLRLVAVVSSQLPLFQLRSGPLALEYSWVCFDPRDLSVTYSATCSSQWQKFAVRIVIV